MLDENEVYEVDASILLSFFESVLEVCPDNDIKENVTKEMLLKNVCSFKEHNITYNKKSKLYRFLYKNLEKYILDYSERIIVYKTLKEQTDDGHIEMFWDDDKQNIVYKLTKAGKKFVAEIVNKDKDNDESTDIS